MGLAIVVIPFTVDVDLNQVTAGHFIVGALPLAFNFHAILRGAMPEAKIPPGQRAFTNFQKNLHFDRQFFVGWCVSHRIDMAAG
jgi:hypothetical protein